MLYALKINSLTTIQKAYSAKLGTADLKVRKKYEAVQQALIPLRSMDEVFASSAGIYAGLRNENATMFLAFSHIGQTIEVQSAVGRLQGCLPSDQPNSLLGEALGRRRVSLHLPDIAGVERKSLEQRLVGSSGREAICNQTIMVEQFSEEGFFTKAIYSNRLLAIVPENFSFDRGALLVTPLGLERSTAFAFGAIIEHQENGPFSLEAINEARTLSHVFTWQIVEKIVAEMFS
ncbi:MAG: hypothetical protein WCW67_03535 [Candidatus Margulisiibacteriota bacterium]|jgi:hypothetical protein